MVTDQTADVAIPVNEKPQWQFSGLRYSDSRRSGDTTARKLGTGENTPVRIANRIHSVARSINRERLAQTAGARRQCSSVGRFRSVETSMLKHAVDAPNRLKSPDQNCRTTADRFSHQIHTVLGMNRIDIQCTWPPKHRSVSRFLTPRTVTRSIATGQVGFGFHNPTSDPNPFDSSSETAAQKLASDNSGTTVKKLQLQRLRRPPIDQPIFLVIPTELISLCIIHRNKLIARVG